MSWPTGGPGGGANSGAARPALYAQSQPPAHNNTQGTMGHQQYPNYQNQNQPVQPAPVAQQYWNQQQYTNNQPQQYQQAYSNNANQYYQYNQAFPNQYQPTYQNNYPPAQYNRSQTQPPQGAEGWEDGWGDWGWDEKNSQHKQPQHIQPNAQHNFNANVLEESFGTNDSWNWSVDASLNRTAQPADTPVSRPSLEANVPNNLLSEQLSNIKRPSIDSLNRNTQSPANAVEEVNVRSLSDREAVKERMPNLALGKRFHLESLTPQWSVESQMSQESSDGPPTHSESTYKSDNQSRNSSKSSPGLNTDNTNFNYSNSALEDVSPQNIEWGQPDDARPDNLVQAPDNAREANEELTNSLRGMNIANREIPTPENVTQESVDSELYRKIEVTPSLPPPAVSPANLNPTPPPTMLPPPLGFPPPSSGQNPFKRAGPISHKNVTKPIGMASPSGLQSLPLPAPMDGGLNRGSPGLSSPAAVNRASQQHGYPTANLETMPDNSERPDQPAPTYRPSPVPQPIVENLEVAPRNDRNEYLQTAHLSSVDYSEYPSVGRLVVGQQEPEYTAGANVSSDEPPPGLARMVPGQQTDTIEAPESYMERHIADGQTTESLRSQFGRGDGRRTPDDAFAQASHNSEHRFGMDRMVPGESGEFRQQFTNANYTGSEQRVVTGVDRDYDASSEPREQNVDGSDYSEAPRNVVGATESLNLHLGVMDYGEQVQPSPRQAERQRNIGAEGQNLQDLSMISSTELSFRDQRVDGADVNTPEAPSERNPELIEVGDVRPSNSQVQSLNRNESSGGDTDRDRAFKASPRRDKRRGSKEQDGRYRQERRSDKEDERKREERRWESRRDRDDERRHRRGARSTRYDTEDTDYYSDRERDRRRHREGSYTSSKPPRPDDKERWHRDHERGERDVDRSRGKRYATIERDSSRRYDDRERDKRYREEGARYGSLRRDKDERKRGDMYSSPPRPDSRDPDPTEDELNETLATAGERRERRHDRPRRDRDRASRHRNYDPYYDRYEARAGYADPYQLQLQQQQQTYRYYEHLRLTDPAAYMLVYKKLMAGQPLPPAPVTHAQYLEGYGSPGFELSGGREERSSVHSGRSSANGLSKDPYEVARGAGGGARDLFAYRSADAAPSIRTDYSGSRDFTTDASLNLALEESTVRSERMTPYKYCTAHVKGNVASQNIVVVRPSYPVDGLPATVQILSMSAVLRDDPLYKELNDYPGPLVKGVTHKKTVMEYCERRVRAAGRASGEGGERDLPGYVLLWELLILLLRQNGVVIGTDIAELLMKNKREYEYSRGTRQQPHTSSRRNSVLSSGTSRSELPEDAPSSPASESLQDQAPAGGEEEEASEQWSVSGSRRTRQPAPARPAPPHPADAEKQALDKYREYLLFGNRKDALEWAMSNKLWGHALQLASTLSDRRVRAAVAARFVAAQPTSDPLHTLYTTMAGRRPPASTCVSDEKWGDWRPHLAIILSNTSARPDVDKQAITTLGDSLSARGLIYAAQFCFLMARVEFSRHPLAPLPAGPRATAAPRLALLTARPHPATLADFATTHAIITTEIYEYACSLNDDTFILTEFQVYKWMLACQLVDCGMYERALGYVEQLARAVAGDPAAYSPHLLTNICHMAERLKYHEPSLQEDPGLAEEEGGAEGDSLHSSPHASPRHTPVWLQRLQALVHATHSTTQAEQTGEVSEPIVESYDQHLQYQQHYAWSQHQMQPDYVMPAQTDTLESNVARDESYEAHAVPYEGEEHPAPAPYSNYADDYYRPSEIDGQPSYSHDTSYWNQQQYGYSEPAEPPETAVGGGAAEEEARPQISMPNSSGGRSDLFHDHDPQPSPAAETQTLERSGKSETAASEGLGGGGGVKQQSGGGWFGGIFNKLSLKPKNQMILPDDKNPTIVWDAERKRWRNTEGDEEEHDGPPPPPPTMAQLSTGAAAPAAASHAGSSSPPPSASAAPPPTSNIFKMQKGRHIKKSYVDVFNPSGAASRAPPAPPPAELLPPAPAAPPSTYFVPSLQ